MPSDLRVAILGSGAMGSLYGGRLTDAGVDVTLIDARADHVQAMAEDGLRIETPDGESTTVEVTATTDPASVGAVDLLVVFVKSTQTDAAMADARPVFERREDEHEDVDVLTLQNGLDNPETIGSFVPERNVVAGVTAHGATLEGPGRVRHAGEGPTTIGRYFADTDERVRAIAQILRAAGFETRVTDAVSDAIWEKVLVNVGINAPTALARVENGLVATTDPGNRVVEAAVTEAARVARAEGHEVRENPVEHVVETARATAANRSSMLQDVEAGRPTEVERLHGAVVDRADALGIDVPVNRTLADLVRLAETGFECRPGGPEP